MSDNDWLRFFTISAQVMGPGARLAEDSESWCAWTTFDALQRSVNYWSAGLPHESELSSVGTIDGGTWGQPFAYNEIAHLIIPAQFYWERIAANDFTQGVRHQDIQCLSKALTESGVPHRLTDLVLEIKLF